MWVAMTKIIWRNLSLMDSPLATTANFVFLWLSYLKLILNFLLMWCCPSHLCNKCLMFFRKCPGASQVEPKCLKLQFKLCVFLFWFRTVASPPRKSTWPRYARGSPSPSQTSLKLFSSFSTFSPPYTSQEVWVQDSNSVNTWSIPNSTEVSSSLLRNPTFLYVI